MSCRNCDITVCLSIVPAITDCADDIAVLLTADETSTWLMQYEFNGRQFGRDILVTEGQNVVLPNVFNEMYTHVIKFYRENGEQVNDTCYILKSAGIIGYGGINSTTGGISDKTRMRTFTIDETSSLFTLEGLSTYTLFPILHLNGTPIEWQEQGVVLDGDTLDFSVLGEDYLQEGMYLTLQYNLP